MPNPSDLIRDEILRFLYNLRSKVKGPKGVSVNFREIQSGLKPSKIKQADIASNLDYLVQKGWVKEDKEIRQYKMPSGYMKDNPKITYRISDIGIDRLEKASIFDRKQAFSGINITTVNGVTVVGSDNIVNTGFTDLARALDELQSQISLSDELSSEEKLNAVADVSSIQGQLAKPKPYVEVVKKVWTGLVAGVSKAGKIADSISKIAILIQPLLK